MLSRVLRTVDNIAIAGTDDQNEVKTMKCQELSFSFLLIFLNFFQVMLQSGLLKPFPQLLRHHEPDIVKKAALTLSNIIRYRNLDSFMIIGQGLKAKNFRVVLVEKKARVSKTEIFDFRLENFMVG